MFCCWCFEYILLPIKPTVIVLQQCLMCSARARWSRTQKQTSLQLLRRKFNLSPRFSLFLHLFPSQVVNTNHSTAKIWFYTTLISLASLTVCQSTARSDLSSVNSDDLLVEFRPQNDLLSTHGPDVHHSQPPDASAVLLGWSPVFRSSSDTPSASFHPALFEASLFSPAACLFVQLRPCRSDRLGWSGPPPPPTGFISALLSHTCQAPQRVLRIVFLPAQTDDRTCLQPIIAQVWITEKTQVLLQRRAGAVAVFSRRCSHAAKFWPNWFASQQNSSHNTTHLNMRRVPLIGEASGHNFQESLLSLCLASLTKSPKHRWNAADFCCSELLRHVDFHKRTQLQTVFSKEMQILSMPVLCFQVLLFSPSWPDAAFRIACTKCSVISQGSRPSLEDPDIGHENDREPKLTMLGTAHTANLGSRCSSSSGLIHNYSPSCFIVADEEINHICKEQEKSIQYDFWNEKLKFEVLLCSFTPPYKRPF